MCSSTPKPKSCCRSSPSSLLPPGSSRPVWIIRKNGGKPFLQCLQNRAAKLIIKNRNIPTATKLQKLNWLPVKEMIAKSSLVLLHKIKNQEICPYFDYLLKKSRCKSFDKIPIYTPTTNSLLNKSFLPRTAYLWNQLTEKTRKLPTPLFKASISAILRSGKTLHLP